MLRLHFSGGQTLLLRCKAVPFVGNPVVAGTGLKRWRGKMQWGRRDALQSGEWRAVGSNGLGSDGAKDDPTTSSSSSSSSTSSSSSSSQAGNNVSVEDTDGFCIIEGRETVLDFSQMQLQEIRDNITSRRNKIFLLMEEVRRLRIQQRIKSVEQGVDTKEPSADNEEMPSYPSSIPFLPPLTNATLKQYYATCFALVSIIILFGGLVAPVN